MNEGRPESAEGGDIERAAEVVEGEIVGGAASADPFAMLGGLDVGSLLGAAQSMQAQMMEAHEQLAATVVEGQAGGGAVRIEVTGGMEFRAVHIDPSAVDPDDPTLLEDLVLAALHEAVTAVNRLQADASPLGGIDFGGFDLGGMFGAG